MTLVQVRLGLPELDLAQRFNISQSSVSWITLTWIILMYHSLKLPTMAYSKEVNTRIIIDATEFKVERPSSLLVQCTTFSACKNTNTVKVLVGITPSGAVSFLPPAYKGSISDRKLVEVSGLLDKLETEDEIIADVLLTKKIA